MVRPKFYVLLGGPLDRLEFCDRKRDVLRKEEETYCRETHSNV